MKNIFVAAILLFALGGAFAQTKKTHFELRGKNTLQRTILKCANLYYFGKGAGKTKLWTEKSQ